MCTKCKNKNKQHRASVGAVAKPFDGMDFTELAEIAAGGLGVKALVNPLSKVLFDNGQYPKLVKWFPLILKGVGAAGLSMIDHPTAKNMSKGALIATLMEAGDLFAPKVFKPQQLKNGIVPGIGDVYGWDDDVIAAVTIDLSDINGLDDEDFDYMNGVEDRVMELESVL